MQAISKHVGGRKIRITRGRILWIGSPWTVIRFQGQMRTSEHGYDLTAGMGSPSTESGMSKMAGSLSRQLSSQGKWQTWRSIGTLAPWKWLLSKMGLVAYGIRIKWSVTPKRATLWEG